jgi:hypothetical protein
VARTVSGQPETLRSSGSTGRPSQAPSPRGGRSKAGSDSVVELEHDLPAAESEAYRTVTDLRPGPGPAALRLHWHPGWQQPRLDFTGFKIIANSESGSLGLPVTRD